MACGGRVGVNDLATERRRRYRPPRQEAVRAASLFEALDLSDGWRREAACRGKDPDLWLPDVEDPAAKAKMARGKAVCARCPVAEQCAAFATAMGEPGVWGGLDERERARESARARYWARQLRRVVVAERLTYAQVGRRFGAAEPNVSGWANGRCRPPEPVRRWIEDRLAAL